MTETNELLDVVLALTRPRRTKIVQDARVPFRDDTIAVVEHPALLDQLEDSIRGTMGAGGGGAAMKSAMTILDTDALHKFMQVSTLIRDWALLTKVPLTRATRPAEALVAWYRAFTRTQPDEARERWYTAKMWSWVAMIEAQMDRPDTATLKDACPYCGSNTWWNPATREEYIEPLLITYRKDDDPVGSAVVTCRACAKVAGAREFAYALEHPGHAEKESGGNVVFVTESVVN